MKRTTLIIRKGQNRPWLPVVSRWPWNRWWWSRKRFAWNCSFDLSCYYYNGTQDHDVDAFDFGLCGPHPASWNDLCGVSYPGGSIRVVWKPCSRYPGEIIIATMVRMGDVSQIKFHGIIECNTTFRVRLDRLDDGATMVCLFGLARQDECRVAQGVDDDGDDSGSGPGLICHETLVVFGPWIGGTYIMPRFGNPYGSPQEMKIQVHQNPKTTRS